MGGGHVLVEMEQIRWVVASLDPGESLPRLPWIGFLYAHSAIAPQKVDVSTGLRAPERLPECISPSLMSTSLVGVAVGRGDVDENAAGAVRIGGRLVRNARNGTAQDPDLRSPLHGSRGLQIMHDH